MSTDDLSGNTIQTIKVLIIAVTLLSKSSFYFYEICTFWWQFCFWPFCFTCFLLQIRSRWENTPLTFVCLVFLFMYLYTVEMTIIDDHFFQELYLRGNNIDFIHPFAFKGLKILYILDISNNELTSVPPLEDVKSTLRDLHLSMNYIKHIKDSYFDQCVNIKLIELGFNQLTQFPNIQNIAKTIAFFVVGDNNISDANFIHGNYFPRLESLNLAFNQIREFCPPPRKFAPRLHTIYLQSNKLSGIHFPYEPHRERRQVHVLLNNNPWHCDGFLGWTQQCEMEDGVYNIMACREWLILHDMVCASPLEAQGLTPKEAGNTSGKCE